MRNRPADNVPPKVRDTGEREVRLAQELRKNIARRKVQKRKRTTAGETAGPEARDGRTQD